MKSLLITGVARVAVGPAAMQKGCRKSLGSYSK